MTFAITPKPALLIAKPALRKAETAFSRELSVKLSPAAADLDKPKKEAVKAARVITKHDYAAIAALKLSGRQEKDIARAFGMSEERLRPHIARAMAEYRQGKIEVNRDAVREEATKKAEEENVVLTDRLSTAVETSKAAVDAAADIVEAAPLPAGSRLSVIA